MKLVIEIGDYIKDGEMRHWVLSGITPTDREGIPTLDKSKQIDELSRLFDLSDAIKEAVERFYQNCTTSSPKDSSNTSGEPGTRNNGLSPS